MGATLCNWMLACLLANPFAGPVELQYRAVVYFAEQHDYTSALVEAQVLGTLYDEDLAWRARFALAQIDSSLALGMPDTANAAAARLGRDVLLPEDQLRLRILFGRDADQRQDWGALDAALSGIGQLVALPGRLPPIPDRVTGEIGFMRVESAIASGQLRRARQLVHDAIPPREELRAFALYNLGVALRDGGAIVDAEQVFAELTESAVFTPVALDVKQRGEIALALVRQQRTESASAQAVLATVPARGRYHDAAMAAYATLSMKQGDYRSAANVWSALIDAAPWSNAGKVAQVGYPICLEHIGSPGAALDAYRRAQADFTKRLDDLTVLASKADEPGWSDQLLAALSRLPDPMLPFDPAVRVLHESLGHDDWVAWLGTDQMKRLLGDARELTTMLMWCEEPDANRGPFAARTGTLRTRAADVLAKRQKTFRTALKALVHDEAMMAQQQLELIRVGIARSTDRLATESAGVAP